MLVILSPAKTLDLEPNSTTEEFTQPRFLDESSKLVDLLRDRSSKQLQTLMGISPKLAQENVERYQQWQLPFSRENAKQALFTFKGDVYVGLEAAKFTRKQLDYVQDNLRILSGLYGILKPLDLVQAYRLEMRSRLSNPAGANLYAFWGQKLSQQLNIDLADTKNKYLLNLASREYFKALKPNSIDANIIEPVFKDWSKGQYKVIGYFAKRARGVMASWVLKHKVRTPQKLQQFNQLDYSYNADLSEAGKLVFVRK